MAIYELYAKANAATEGTLRAVFTASIIDVTVLTPFRLRVEFDRPMVVNEALLNPANWVAIGSIVDVTFGYPLYYADTVGIVALSVDAGDGAVAASVVINVTEQTELGEYRIKNVAGAIGEDGVTLDVEMFKEFEGRGGRPVVASGVSKSLTTMDVTFSENMDMNAAILDTRLYTFPDLVVNSVEAIGPRTVRLHTAQQVAGKVYELVIANQGLSALDDFLQIPDGPLLFPSFMYKAGEMADDQAIIAKYGSDLLRVTQVGEIYQNDMFQAGSELDKQMWNNSDDFEGVGGQVALESAIWEFIFTGHPAFTRTHLFECWDNTTGDGWRLDFYASGTGDGFRFTIQDSATPIVDYVSSGPRFDGIGIPRHMLISFDHAYQRLKMWCDGLIYFQNSCPGWSAIDLTKGRNQLLLTQDLNHAQIAMWKGTGGRFYDLDAIALERYNKMKGIL